MLGFVPTNEAMPVSKSQALPGGRSLKDRFFFVRGEYGFLTPQTMKILCQPGETERFEDIVGPNICNVMRKVGWQFIAEPLTVLAFDSGSGRLAGAGWAAPIVLPSKSVGLNLTYAVQKSYEGLGIARACAALAGICAAEQDLCGDFVNVQCSASNIGSMQVALSLGLCPYSKGSFTANNTPYLAFRAATAPFVAAAMGLVQRSEICLECAVDQSIPASSPKIC